MYKDMCKMIDDHLKRVERLSEQVDVIAEIQDEDRNKEIKVNQFLDKSN